MYFKKNIVRYNNWLKRFLTESVKEKEGTMEKKYLKKVLTGISIAGLVAGVGSLAIGASG
jgi:radical SAM modification target selenobiotic family peptide